MLFLYRRESMVLLELAVYVLVRIALLLFIGFVFFTVKGIFRHITMFVSMAFIYWIVNHSVTKILLLRFLPSFLNTRNGRQTVSIILFIVLCYIVLKLSELPYLGLPFNFLCSNLFVWAMGTVILEEKEIVSTGALDDVWIFFLFILAAVILLLFNDLPYFAAPGALKCTKQQKTISCVLGIILYPLGLFYPISLVLIAGNRVEGNAVFSADYWWAYLIAVILGLMLDLFHSFMMDTSPDKPHLQSRQPSTSRYNKTPSH